MPLALIGMAAMTAGTAMQIAGNAKSQSAMNSVRAQESAKQADLQRQSSALFQKSLAGSTPQVAADQMAAGAANRSNIWQGLQSASTPVASALPATPTTGTATAKASKRTGSATSAWNNLTQGAAAREGSYSDWQTKQAIKNADTAQNLGVINNFSQGDAALMPIEMKVASEQGDKLSGWGSIMQSIGMLTGMAGATGAFGGAAAPPTGAQMGALNAGFGPVNATYAASIPQTAIDAGNGSQIWNSLYGTGPGGF